ncbi:conserved hypothetical protein [Bathymodiolus platifrons methanotrophic gill symbiont]|uniref:nucleotidyltransferase domain-containing protein n=1 Tax=Bathymodiolus platifrons methanotrophic gill symbiont TaxID=113268 RepID=UPI000B7102A0|nr:nucleotidyltransferase domain-containing protein [Bathymodiolus platifrons methanotrophic gill symbiont]MCK5869661.1 nucleotidyltransferase domain-containing protein [Methyloprofundus sp.]GAW85120.1 conserved hypothetical protein [Bathymodiolus platifrons methanotrophic gill symbiont]GFO77542.1 hypothetical protein BPLS_P6031 [Bathymodiolus platifrons methanotrophic gill symbiont]
MIDLRENDQKRICELIERNFNEPLEVWAYGSRINGTNHDASDLDLVMRGANSRRLDWEQVMNFCEQLKDSNIPIIVEARDWARLPTSFHQQILKKYEVLYTSLSG